VDKRIEPLNAVLPRLGCMKEELETPALCLDLDVFEQNIRRMADECRRHHVAWRPHAKCHKSAAIAKKLVEAGASGMTCAKLGEAEVFAAAGVRDLLIANLIVGSSKLRRLAALRHVADPIVCVDHMDQVRALSNVLASEPEPVRVLIEVDLGLDRVGVRPGEAVLNLASRIVDSPGLQLAGVMGYEGHLLLVADPEEKARAIRSAIDQLTHSADLLRKNNLPCPIVSCGGTGSYMVTLSCPGITEIQAGGAIFMDEFYRNRCHVTDFDFALTVLTTVVSRPAENRAIVDAGRKTMNMEVAMPRVVGRDDVEVSSLSAEHGLLRLGPAAQDLRIGDHLEFVPGYGDLTTVLHNRFYGIRDGRLAEIWPLEARGRLD
jgi:D-serine deaminase-like pyridoxal phosphate-dependent protein